MRIKLYRTTTFQLTFLASLAFVIVGAAVYGFSYWNLTHLIDAQIDMALERESADMNAAYDKGGYEGLRQIIMGRASSQPDALRIYLVAAPGRELVGNLKQWPANMPETGAASEIQIPQTAIGASVRTLAFPGNVRVLVGRVLSERDNLQIILTKSLWGVLTANLLLGIASGALLAQYARRRLGQINATAHMVLEGNLLERIPVGTGGDEYDHLAQNINAMLDRIQVLVTTMRGVTENIAHDLRTPLNRLRSRMEVALMSPRTPKQYCEALECAIVDSETIIKTFNSILKISQMRAGTLDLPLESFNLAEVVEELVDLYQAFAEESGVTLEAKLPATNMKIDAVRVSGDPHLISQAAANLLDNAIKYSQRGGKVVISADRTPDSVRLTVADSGPGIPASARLTIIDRYVRGEATEGKPGFGLGLSFASAVAKWNGASLVLADNTPGLRATLVFPI